MLQSPGAPAGGGAGQQRRGDGGLTSREQAYQLRMGERGYQRFEALKRDERQRVWDAMRRIAAARYKEGIMPSWFRREWLDIEEAPMNTWWRQQGLSAYRLDTSWLGDNAPSPGGGGGGGGGGGQGGGGGGWPRWWREEDPYWPLRDYGDHPMRWWTWALAAVMAAGGVAVHAQTGCPRAVQLGLGSGALLGMAAVAMSDMRAGPIGHLGVKGAWALCVLLACLDFGPQGLRPRHACAHGGSSGGGGAAVQAWGSVDGGGGGFRGTGWVCAAMASLYMLTGMSGLSEHSLPTNPGEAFKMVDVAQRHKVWDYWGYGGLTMRT